VRVQTICRTAVEGMCATVARSKLGKRALRNFFENEILETGEVRLVTFDHMLPVGTNTTPYGGAFAKQHGVLQGSLGKLWNAVCTKKTTKFMYQVHSADLKTNLKKMQH